MVTLSLLLNILVLLPVCLGLISDAQWTRSAYGDVTPGRGILLSVYISIGISSVVLLIHRQPTAVATLLAVQIIYKLMTPFTVGTFANPVVISNLAIAAFHLATVATLWLGGVFSKPPA